MTARTLNERIDSHRTALAWLLKRRIAVDVRDGFGAATRIWIREGDRVSIRRITGPGGTVLWDADVERSAFPFGSRPPRAPSGLYAVLGDLELFAALQLVDAPRTADGYLIVKLPAVKEASP